MAGERHGRGMLCVDPPLASGPHFADCSNFGAVQQMVPMKSCCEFSFVLPPYLGVGCRWHRSHFARYENYNEGVKPIRVQLMGIDTSFTPCTV
jgi:hypothetical protein